MQTYDSYKDSGIDWLGEIPKHWEVKKVKEVSSLYGRIGFRGYNQSDLVGEGEGCITISPSNIVDNHMVFAKNSYLSWEKYYESPEIMIFNDDILIVKTGSTVGKVGIVKNLNEKATINPQLLVLKNIKMNVDFYYEYLHSSVFFDLIKSNAIGSTIPTISETKIGNLPILTPPLPEQEAIARFLDDKCAKIDELVAIKEQQIDKLKELRQVKIHHAVTKGINPNAEMKDSGIDWIGEIPKHWEVKRLKFQSKLNNNKCNARDSNLPYYGMENIESMTGKHIETESEVEGIANVFYKGNVLFGKLRPYLAKVHLAKEEGLCSSEFLVFEGQKYNCEYLFKLLLSPEFIKIVNASTYGAKMPRANSDFIINQFVPIPPLPEQEAIVAYLDEATNKIDQAIAQREAQIEKLKAYKQSLINEVVTGKVKVC